MARTKRSAKLDTRNARIKLAVAQYYMEPIANGQYIIYRKPKSGAAGSWSACFVNPDTKKQTRTLMGTADDYQDSDGNSILSFAQAQAKAVKWFKTKHRQATLEADGEILPTGPFTVADALEAYYVASERRGNKSISVVKSYAKIWILPYFRNTPVSKLTRIKIENWLDEMINTPKRLRTKFGCEQAYAPPPLTEEDKRARKCTANRVLATLKTALTQAVNRRLCDAPERPWQLVKLFGGVEKSRLRFLSAEEQIRLVQACPPYFKELVLGALFTGCRYGELTRLRTKDYDPQNGTIFIEHSKSGKPRYIYLTQEGISFFTDQTANKDPQSLIFTVNKKRITRKGFESGVWMPSDSLDFMKAACEKAGIEKLTFHELRHTYASMLMNKGVPLVYIASQLGHCNTAMVEKFYGHIAPSAMAQAIRQAIPKIGYLESEEPQK